MFVSNEQVGDEVDAYQSLVTVGDPTKLIILYSAPDKEALKDVQEGTKVALSINGGKKDAGIVVQTQRSFPSGLPEDVADLYLRSLLFAYEGARGVTTKGQALPRRIAGHNQSE